jgi:hypothetical protein
LKKKRDELTNTLLPTGALFGELKVMELTIKLPVDKVRKLLICVERYPAVPKPITVEPSCVWRYDVDIRLAKLAVETRFTRFAVDMRLAKLAVETRFTKFAVDISVARLAVEMRLARLAVETRFTKFAVDISVARLAVETRFTKFAVETKFARFAVETNPYPPTLVIAEDKYPTVPRPITVDVKFT